MVLITVQERGSLCRKVFNLRDTTPLIILKDGHQSLDFRDLSNDKYADRFAKALENIPTMGNLLDEDDDDVFVSE